MSETILAAEPTIRLAALLGVLATMALWEGAAPRRRREIPRMIRWTNDLARVVVDFAIHFQHGLFHAVPGLWRLHRMHHADIDLPRPVDRILRLFVVTPDMHRVHHSIDPRETNSNTGFSLPWWDRPQGTHVARPAKGHQGLEAGIEQFRTRRDLWRDRMPIQPVRGPASGRTLDAHITEKESSE